MRTGFPSTWLGALLIVCALGPGASRASAASEGTAVVEPCPCEAVSVFTHTDVASEAPRLRLDETLTLSGTRVGGPTVFLPALAGGYGGAVSNRMGGKRSIALAILSSAVLPGLGELYVYLHTRDPWTLARVPVFFAAEGALWYAYQDNHSKGKDFKSQYETYADAHWSLDRFLQEHPCCAGLGGCDSWQQYNSLPSLVSCSFNFFIYTPLEADPEEYYENLGKYNAFVYGWDDWAGQSDYRTPHRNYYWSLRGESDKYLKGADQDVMWLIVNRVVSMIDAGWLAYRASRGHDPDKGWSLDVRSYDETPSLIIARRF